jgi:CheY-like chemotaxis protein
MKINAKYSISPQHILLAEDDKLNQKVTLLMLKRLGYKADVASNGMEVLEALGRQSYDLVLMNIGMPEMDGIETTRRIRRRWQNGLKIIAITAYVLPGIRAICLEAGMDGYIGKPVKMEELAMVLGEYPLSSVGS